MGRALARRQETGTGPLWWHTSSGKICFGANGAASDTRDSRLSAFLPPGKLWRSARRSPAWWCTSLRTAQVRLGADFYLEPVLPKGGPHSSGADTSSGVKGHLNLDSRHKLWRYSQGSLCCRSQKVKMRVSREETSSPLFMPHFNKQQTTFISLCLEWEVCVMVHITLWGSGYSPVGSRDQTWVIMGGIRCRQVWASQAHQVSEGLVTQ